MKKILTRPIKLIALKVYNSILDFIQGPGSQKARHEFKYWKARKAEEKILTNKHYMYFYTTHFGLGRAFFNGKKILDIGCGPRGSLEWADMARERIGLDSLANSYLKLGAIKHKMRYVMAHSEHIPFPDEYFDVVSSFNSLDHVDNLGQSISEIIKVITTNGLFLLLTDVNHNPTCCEPQEYSWDIVKKFTPNLKVLKERHYERLKDGMYESIRAGIPYNHANKMKRHGVLSVKFIKTM